MITPDWVRMMARYNAWQNQSMGRAMSGLSLAALIEDRGAFFGSILATAGHLAWADAVWLHRLKGDPAPEYAPGDVLTRFPTFAAWMAERQRLDARLTLWAANMRQVELTGTTSWFSGILDREVSQPVAQIVTHIFNHQTHHRGQVHAMLTAAGVKTEDTDLLFMGM